jgi:hypothetical protein
MLPSIVLSPTTLALVERVYGKLPPLNDAGNWKIARACDARLAEPRQYINARQVCEVIGLGLTRVGELKRAGEFVTQKSGASKQSACRYCRDSVLRWQIAEIVRTDGKVAEAAE